MTEARLFNIQHIVLILCEKNRGQILSWKHLQSWNWNPELGAFSKQFNWVLNLGLLFSAVWLDDWSGRFLLEINFLKKTHLF